MEHADMEDQLDSSTDAGHNADRCAPIGRLRVVTQVPRQDQLPRAASVACQNFITLPSWFTAAQAHAVLRLKGKTFALVSDAKGARAVAHIQDLAAAPPNKNLNWCLSTLGPAVADVTPLDEALRVLDHHGANSVPVVLGGVMLGVLGRGAALEALATATAPAVPSRLAA